jgi:hypothetical protein
MEQLARGVVCDEVRFQLRTGGVINEAALMLGWGGIGFEPLGNSVHEFQANNLKSCAGQYRVGGRRAVVTGRWSQEGMETVVGEHFWTQSRRCFRPCEKSATLRRDRGLSALSPQIEDGDCRCICIMENRLSP